MAGRRLTLSLLVSCRWDDGTLPNGVAECFFPLIIDEK